MLVLSAVPAARAAGGQLPGVARGIGDGAYFNAGDPAARALGIARAKRAGATLVRVQVSWRYTVYRPAPTREEARDPAFDGYEWTSVDRIVRELTAAGIEPLAVVRRAPAFYEAQPRYRFAANGSWVPDPAAYGDFAVALARRYDGTWPDPDRPGRTLPRVRYWQAWNEPNLPTQLTPQWVARNGRWVPFAPAHYRRMLDAFQAGMKSVQPDAVILTAGTAPLGDPDGTGRMAPVRFWQSFFCLGRPPALTPSPCPVPARFDVFAHHPFSVGDPDAPGPTRVDAGVADLHRLLRLLRAAERTGRAPGRARHPLWITELNWDTRPPDPAGLTPRQQHRFVSRALFRLAAEGAEAIFWHFISDPLERRHPAGLWLRGRSGRARDRPKPALDAFRFPFVAARSTERRVRVWGLTPRTGVRRASIQKRRGGRWRTIGRVTVTRAGVLRGTVTTVGTSVLRARIAGERSPAWRVGPG